MGKFIDLVGQRFGFWVVVKRAPTNKSGKTQWLCQCECGTLREITANSLRTGNSTSCGCNHTPNLIGNVFGKLTVIDQDTTSKLDKSRRYWHCQCHCGNLVTHSTYELRNLNILTCKECAKRQFIYTAENLPKKLMSF